MSEAAEEAEVVLDGECFLPEDAGTGRLRLAMGTMRRLGLRPGDAVLVQPSSATPAALVCRAWPWPAQFRSTLHAAADCRVFASSATAAASSAASAYEGLRASVRPFAHSPFPACTALSLAATNDAGQPPLTPEEARGLLLGVLLRPDAPCSVLLPGRNALCTVDACEPSAAAACVVTARTDVRVSAPIARTAAAEEDDEGEDASEELPPAVGGLEKELAELREAVAAPLLAGAALSVVPRGVLLKGEPGCGKCLSPETPVLLADGCIVRADAISPGALLVGDDGTARVVLTTTAGVGPLFRVRPRSFSDGDGFVCNDEHLLVVVPSSITSQNRAITVKCADLFEEQLRSGSEASRFKAFRSSVDRFPLEFDLQAMTQQHLRKVDPSPTKTVENSEVARMFGLSLGAQVDVSCIEFKIAQSIARDLCSPSGIPFQLLGASRTVRIHLLAGIIDALGHYCSANRCFEIIQERADVSQTIVSLARGLGFQASSLANKILISGACLGSIPVLKEKAPIQEIRADTGDVFFEIEVEKLEEGKFVGFTLGMFDSNDSFQSFIDSTRRGDSSVERMLKDGAIISADERGSAATDGRYPGRFLLGDFTVTHNTLLARTVAYSCGARVFAVNGPELVGSRVGETEEAVRRVFSSALKCSATHGGSAGGRPVMVFLDEVDALCPAGSDPQNEGRVVAQVCAALDRIASSKKARVAVVAATNRPNAVDPALRRPGRLEIELEIPVPGPEARLSILRVCSQSMPLAEDINLAGIARKCVGYVGADISALCREAAMAALRENTGTVSEKHFVTAMRRVTPSTSRATASAVSAESLGRVSWDDIGGYEDVKRELREAVEWPLLHADDLERMGVRPSRGILLHGPPGCSKSSLVRAAACSSGASFLTASGAAVYSPYLGDAEAAVRELFRRARLAAPSLVFFDEIDAIVGSRGGAKNGGGDEVRERVLSTLLNEMDGVEQARGVVVVAATNRPDLLDSALMRPGRFDRAIEVGLPDNAARREILRVHTRKMPLDSGVDLDALSGFPTAGMSGADIACLCREAAMAALRESISLAKVSSRHFESARSSVARTSRHDKQS